MQTPRRTIILPNYSVTEGLCACGCGFGPTDACWITHQAFHDLLERRYGRRVRHRITGPARCRPHNKHLISIGIKADKNSRHIFGEALDGIWEVETSPGRWEQIPNVEIAKLAIKSGLFGGVGYLIYPKLGKNLVHLDVRSGGEIDVW